MNLKPTNIKQFRSFINLRPSSLFRCFQTICGVCYNCTFQNTNFQFYYLMTLTQTEKISLENPLKVVQGSFKEHVIRKMEFFDTPSPNITLCHFFQTPSVLCDSLKVINLGLKQNFCLYGCYRICYYIQGGRKCLKFYLEPMCTLTCAHSNKCINELCWQNSGITILYRL